MEIIKRVAVSAILLIAVLLGVAGCSKAPTTSQPPASSTAVLDSQKSANFVSAAWLKDNLNSVILLDARTEKEYQAGHIPGALNATWQSLSNMNGKPGDKGWGTLLPKDELSKKIGALGIDGSKPVVVYADPKGWGEDGRVVWTLRVSGIQNSKMLDGGWKVWQAAKYEVSTAAPPAITSATYTIASMDDSFNATTDWILANKDKIKIVDARTPKEYAGATDFGEARGGRLPGAISLPFQNTFNDDGTIKSTDELKAIFANAGLKPNDVIVTYCTKGIRSAHLALLLRMAGFNNTRNYDASYYEWAGNKALQVEK
ncbi:MAG: sulfurtransferase [Thermacetogeniaceae bacterium]